MVVAIIPSQPPCSSIAVDNSNNNGGFSFSRENRLLRILSECRDMSQLKQIHAQTLRTTSTHYNPETLFLYSRILHFSSMADTDYAFRVFHQIETPNSFMWNTLIRACARTSELKEKAMALYRAMLEQGLVWPDKYTFPFVLSACAYLFAFREGIQAHCHVAKLGFGSDVYVNNSLIHFYASCGRLDFARKVFDKMPERSVVSWNAVIDGFVRSGEFQEALSLFGRMMSVFEPDGYTMQSVVNACAGLGALSLGMWAHGYALRRLDRDDGGDALLGSCLIEMYCKCGSLDMARQVFERMPERGITAWNSMILGLAMHGQAESALACFSRLVVTESFGPNSITFIGVLSACNHGGLVNEGCELFNAMVNEYNVEPKLEHYGCLIDLLARAGLVDEALDLVTNMPMKPDAVIWRSLLDACAKQEASSVELSEEMARQIVRSEGTASSGVYVLLSRVYASASRWNDVGSVRKLMTDEGVTKEPGCSLIEVAGVAHEFFSGDTSHPRSIEIYRFLDVIRDKLRSMGYSPDYSQAPMVDENGDGKQRSLAVHSERIAVAYALLSSKPGIPIRVFKNLRVCNDCHNVFKLISAAFDVEIIMRDRTRFHHFKQGACSCNDYW